MCIFSVSFDRGKQLKSYVTLAVYIFIEEKKAFVVSFK